MKVFVGLSGGVDSSVAAALLKQRGYEVIGVYMKNWTEDLPGIKCPWKEDLNDARAVAAHLDIPFKVYDFQREYRDQVVGYMLYEYRAGRTPNPDIMCNQEIKFKLFLETALADGADMLATGHYARVKDGRLYMARDQNKDQTYFLYRVGREALKKTLMPVGDYTKPEVRELATKFGLPTATKKDSQGLCFVGPVGMKQFLSQYVATEPGPIMLNGQQIGEHQGVIFFTIGQRSGLGVGGGKPFFVIDKDMDTNTVYVTDDSEDLELATNHVQLDDVFWIIEPKSARLRVRFRHRGKLYKSELDDKNTLYLDESAKAIAAGQSAVLYDGDECLGGGVIKAAVPALP